MVVSLVSSQKIVTFIQGIKLLQLIDILGGGDETYLMFTWGVNQNMHSALVYVGCSIINLALYCNLHPRSVQF